MTLVSGDIYSVIIGSFEENDAIEYYLTAIDNSVTHNEAIEDNDGQYFTIFIGSADITGPSITKILLTPSAPTEIDTVSIRAIVTDDSGVQSVTLYYRVNNGQWIEVSLTLLSGDYYSGSLGSFAIDDTIEYYISALDNSASHNLATNDNSGKYYSFTITSESDSTFSVTFSILPPTITFLVLVFGIVLHQRRKSA